MGKVIVTADVEIRKDDTIEQLEERMHETEHKLIVEGTRLAAESLQR